MVSIGVPLYNNCSNFINLYFSLIATAPRSQFEVLVYPDGPDPDVLRTLDAFCTDHGIRLLPGGKSRGVSFGWNRLVEAADSDIVLLLNDDVRAQKAGWFDQLYHAFHENEDVGLVYWGQIIVDPASGVHLRKTEDTVGLERCNPGGPIWRHNFNGSSFAFRKNAWRVIRQPDGSTGFWEDLLAYCEEIDFSSELHLRGYRILQLPFIFEHLHSQTFNKNPELRYRQVLSSYLDARAYQAIRDKYPASFRQPTPSLRARLSGRIRRLLGLYTAPQGISRREYSLAMVLKKWENESILLYPAVDYIRELDRSGYPSALLDAYERGVVTLPGSVAFLDAYGVSQRAATADCFDLSKLRTYYPEVSVNRDQQAV